MESTHGSKAKPVTETYLRHLRAEPIAILKTSKSRHLPRLLHPLSIMHRLVQTTEKLLQN